uniref:Uncharacterized protein n=1 Tax=Photinus pyralis TaxID=7054 RepID=A0A1Y1MWZ8_PHOPY
MRYWGSKADSETMESKNMIPIYSIPKTETRRKLLHHFQVEIHGKSNFLKMEGMSYGRYSKLEMRRISNVNEWIRDDWAVKTASDKLLDGRPSVCHRRNCWND